MARLSPRLDFALVAALAVIQMQSAFDGGELKQPAWAVILLIQLTVVPLLFRQRWPLAVFALTLAAALAGLIAFNGFQLLGPLIALYTVARLAGHSTSVGALAAGLAASGVPLLTNADENPAFVVVIGLGFVAAWLVGRNAAAREAELEAAAAAIAQAVEDERARIARELHDVIAHNVSVMVVQASAGRDVFSSRPDSALEALGAVERSGREALGELRRLLGSVRAPSGDAAETLAPQPTLDRLPALVERVRATGLAVTIDVDCGATRLSQGVELSAYRIIQEALTNVLKHAEATAATVRLRCFEDALELDVTDNGSGHSGSGAAGRGLIGMRERVRLLGGGFHAGPEPGGGFGVHATVPLA